MKYLLTLAALLVSSLMFGQEACPNLFDSNGNDAVDIEDFLMVLSLFSDVDADSDGIWDSQDDCMDLEACNYAASPTEPCAYVDVLGECGGGCEGDGDGDGICDDIDTCIGVEDECGVCNGPGPTEVVIDDITILYDSVYAENIDTWFVYEIGQDTTFSYTCAPFFGGCGDPVGHQGYDYATVLIGDQCWFAENLRSENYENGDAIPSNLSDSEWSSTTSGAVAVYGEDAGCNNDSPDIDACDPAQSLEEYGRLYNWYAVDDARGLCPSGWHVTTDGEWTVMTDELGGQSIAGGQMKTTYGWQNGGNGTNSSGFSGLPGGGRYSDGSFDGAGSYAYWWSSSPDGSYAWDRYLSSDSESVGRYVDNRRDGSSVRCVRGAE
ncbi:fibrobacter succinogenes major paralogous domain-containing protein [Flavobacteriales bacterium]|nr:fibrobacter succinogenes major paralogous domain-containing protein [Flavobacteriales bacterium]